jgi:hypothetical protein
MRRHALLRFALLLIFVCAFAALDAIVKGHHGGTRNAVGNVSAPWALLPFLSTAFVLPRRPMIGALVGAASTSAALACYSIVREGAFGVGGQHRDPSSAVIAAAANRWFLLGAIGGALLGAVGSWLAVKGQWGIVAAVVASLLVLEPAARVLWAIAQGNAARTMIPSPAVWGVEVICGCAAAVGFKLRRAWQR